MSVLTAPHNVRVVLTNGAEIAVECRYIGIEDGVHVWESVHLLPDQIAAVRVDMLPAKTAIRLQAVSWRPPAPSVLP